MKKDSKQATLRCRQVYRNTLGVASSFLNKLAIKLSKPEMAFLLLATLFGLVLVFLTPPLQEPDANSHFLRAYQVSNSDVISSRFEIEGRVHYGSEIPSSVNDALSSFLGNVPGQPTHKFNKNLFSKFISQPLNPHLTEPTIIEAAGVYSPIVYAPQATGINIGKIFNASPLILIWLGRLANLTVWLTVVYFAIKVLPFAKWGLVVLALNPVAVFFSASLSPDVINISFAFLFVSLILSTWASSNTVTRKKLYFTVVILGVLALSKPVNVLFALLLFSVPVKKFRSKFRYLGFCVGGLVIAVSLFALWNYQIKDILDAAVYSQSGGQNISVKHQFTYILSAPFGYLKDIVKNYVLITPGTYGDAVFTTYFGVFGWLDTTIPLWTIVMYVLTLGFTVLYQFGRGVYFSNKQKIFFCTIFGLAFVGNVTAMYFNATPVGSHIISGVQGRYFMPFSILLLTVFTGRRKILRVMGKEMALITFLAMFIVLGVSLLKIYLRYYY